jgi:hypothetical protein
MIQDLSFIHEKTPEEQEEAIRNAVEQECIRAMAIYLEEVADTMDSSNIMTLNSATIRAMAAEFSNRLTENGEN